MTHTTFSQKDVQVVVSDNTVRINKPSTLQLSFSSTTELTVSVSGHVADMICGACGTPMPDGTTLSLQGTSTIITSLNITQWTAHDFSPW